VGWYFAVLSKYAVFSGRARRREYWFFTLFNALIVLGLSVVGSVLSGSSAVGIFGMFSIIYGLGVLIPSLAVTVRRLHDTGRSGWWLLMGLVPVVGAVVLYTGRSGWWLLMGLVLVVGAVVLLVFMFFDSESGENEYGPSPKFVEF